MHPQKKGLVLSQRMAKERAAKCFNLKSFRCVCLDGFPSHTLELAFSFNSPVVPFTFATNYSIISTVEDKQIVIKWL